MIILLAFCLSNVTALIYQIVWGRELGYIFGTDVYAISTVLASYMAGLALGSYYFGRIIDHVKDPVKFFAYLQIAIGAYGLVIIALFKFIPYVYFFIYDIFSWNQQMFIISLFILTFILLIIPTTLIGGAFPVISRIINNEPKRIGKDIGMVYSVDTLGACIGVIIGGFILLPLLGLSNTAIIASMINIFLGIFILVLFARKTNELER